MSIPHTYGSGTGSGPKISDHKGRGSHQVSRATPQRSLHTPAQQQLPSLRAGTSLSVQNVLGCCPGWTDYMELQLGSMSRPHGRSSPLRAAWHAFQCVGPHVSRLADRALDLKLSQAFCRADGPSKPPRPFCTFSPI